MRRPLLTSSTELIDEVAIPLFGELKLSHNTDGTMRHLSSDIAVCFSFRVYGASPGRWIGRSGLNGSDDMAYEQSFV